MGQPNLTMYNTIYNIRFSKASHQTRHQKKQAKTLANTESSELLFSPIIYPLITEKTLYLLVRKKIMTFCVTSSTSKTEIAEAYSMFIGCQTLLKVKSLLNIIC